MGGVAPPDLDQEPLHGHGHQPSSAKDGGPEEKVVGVEPLSARVEFEPNGQFRCPDWFGLTTVAMSPTMPGRHGTPCSRSPIHLANARPDGATNQKRFPPSTRGNAV